MSTTRIQLALNVENIAEATAFYQQLFGVPPHKQRDGYANFVSAALARFQAAGLETRLAEQDLCCHAVHDKVFVTAPDVPLGWWEYYTVTDDNPATPAIPGGDSTTACGLGCSAGDASEVSCCA